MKFDHLKDLRFTGPYHLNDDTILSRQSHPVATLSEAFHRQVSTPTGAVASDDAVLLAASYDLLEEYRRLRKAAIAYLDAEREYRLAHDKQEAGIGVTLKASKAEAALRELLQIKEAE